MGSAKRVVLDLVKKLARCVPERFLSSPDANESSSA
jgi:hypothetical protein